MSGPTLKPLYPCSAPLHPPPYVHIPAANMLSAQPQPHMPYMPHMGVSVSMCPSMSMSLSESVSLWLRLTVIMSL